MRAIDKLLGSITGFISRESIKVLFLLGFTAWIAYFSHARSFGLYEDDYHFIASAIGWDLPQLIKEILANFLLWPQGRPIGFSLPPLISFLGFRIGGLYAVYIIGLMILTLNSFLFYNLLRRIGSRLFAIIGGLVFCLFPADTTRPFLMHATGLQPSLTFLLIASLCYLAGRRRLSYLVIIGSLLTYESPFMIFYAIPLLKNKWDKQLFRELLKHFIILSTIIIFVVVIRHFTGDTRITFSSNIYLVTIKILVSMVIGPIITIVLFFYGPIKTLFNLDIFVTLTILVSFFILVWIFYKLATNSNNRPLAKVAVWRVCNPPNTGLVGLKARPTKSKIDFRKRSNENDFHKHMPSIPKKITDAFEYIRLSSRYWGMTKLLLTAIIMLSLAYSVSFTHFPPIARYGRLTSVHLAAVFGGSLLFACVSAIAYSYANRPGYKAIVIVVLAFYFSLAAGYGALIQNDFSRSWSEQRRFWTDVIANTPDLEDGTVILYTYDNKGETKFIHTHSWADPIILRQIYKFPTNWRNPPRLFTVNSDWLGQTILNGQQIEWNVPPADWPSHLEVLPSANVILLQTVNGQLVRSESPINIHGLLFPLKVASTPIYQLDRGPLFSLLIDYPDSGVP
jgi:hypothetical protein